MQSQYEQSISELAVQVVPLDVLMVDENSNDLKYHAELFETLGFRVSRCASYQTAIYSILQGRTFDLAVVDQGSAAFDGRVVVRHLRPLTPFVVLARNYCMECYLEAMGLGAADYLEKPISLAEINHVLRECVGSIANRGKESQSGDAARFKPGTAWRAIARSCAGR